MSSEPPGEFWFHLIMNLLCGLWKVLFVLVLFNSEFALWTPEGPVSSGSVLSSVCSTGSGKFCVFWFHFILSLLSGLWNVL